MSWIAAWTSEEWAAEIRAREGRLAQLQDQLTSAMPVKTEPDQDTLALWNSMAREQKRPLVEEIDRLAAELAELKAI